MSAFIPNPKTDPDYGRGISPYDSEPEIVEPIKCYWCDEIIDEDEEPTMYDGKPHHANCACENERNDREALL